jgi:hypothetical protein
MAATVKTTDIFLDFKVLNYLAPTRLPKYMPPFVSEGKIMVDIF